MAAAARASDDAGSESAPGSVFAPGQEAAAAACGGGSESLNCLTVTAPPPTAAPPAGAGPEEQLEELLLLSAARAARAEEPVTCSGGFSRRGAPYDEVKTQLIHPSVIAPISPCCFV